MVLAGSVGREKEREGEGKLIKLICKCFSENESFEALSDFSWKKHLTIAKERECMKVGKKQKRKERRKREWEKDKKHGCEIVIARASMQKHVSQPLFGKGEKLPRKDKTSMRDFSGLSGIVWPSFSFSFLSCVRER